MKSAIIAHFLRVFSRLFSPYFFRRSALKQVKRPGPAVNGNEPEYTRPHIGLPKHRLPYRLPSTYASSATVGPHGVYDGPPYIALEKG